MKVPAPTEIKRANQHDLEVVWADGHRSLLLARELRLACPCAACVDELTSQKLLNPAQVPADVHPLAVSLVGRYAVHVQWSDGHDTGIYSFEKLKSLCPCAACRATAETAVRTGGNP